MPHFIIHPSYFILFPMSPVAASGKPFVLHAMPQDISPLFSFNVHRYPFGRDARGARRSSPAFTSRWRIRLISICRASQTFCFVDS